MNSSMKQETYNPPAASYEYAYDMVPQFNRERTLSPVNTRRGLTAKLRQKIDTISNRQLPPINSSGRPKSSLSQLSTENHELLLRTVEAIKQEDSKNVIETLDISRDLLRSSYEEFKQEQDQFRKQLEAIVKYKEAAIQRPKENLIPLSILLRQKHDVEGLADLRPNSSMNPTYHAYFEALLVQGDNQQHPTDRAAVVKYIRRRERRKRAEENKTSHTISADVLEKRAAELLQNKEGIDMRLEIERQRHNELLRSRMNEKKVKATNIVQANEIIDQAAEANVLRQRVEQAQREKIEARLSAIRQQQNRSPANMIHVQSRGDEIGEGDASSLNDEEKKVTKESIELLHEHTGYGSRPGTSNDARTTTGVTSIEI